MDRYRKMEILGSGSFGIAWLVQNTKREQCVIKEISIPAMKMKDKEAAINEVKILSTLRHKNIVRYKEAFIHEKNLCICMEYADDGDLSSKIKEQCGRLFLELKVIDWFVQILIAVRYIHGLRILHRDLKSQNIFLTTAGLVKVGDFGISRFLDSGLQQARTAIGTPYYLSPEICQQKPYNHKSDMWSLGVLLYELSTLKHPFMADDFSSLVVKIIKGEYQSLSNAYGPLVQDIVLVLLQVRPDDRPSAAQLLKVPLLQPHVKSYLMRVKHKEEPVIFDSGICLNSDEEKGKRKSSPDTSRSEVDKSGEFKSRVFKKTDCVFQSKKTGKKVKKASETSGSSSDSFEKSTTCCNDLKPCKTVRYVDGAVSHSRQTQNTSKEEKRKSITPTKAKASKVNFIERNKCLASSGGKRTTQVRLPRTRRLNTTPSPSPSLENKAEIRYNLRSRGKSTEQRVPLLAARVKQLSGETTTPRKSTSSNVINNHLKPRVIIDPMIKFPNVRKRAASLMSLVVKDERDENVPCKLTKRISSCEDKHPSDNLSSAGQNPQNQVSKRRLSADFPKSKRDLCRPRVARSRTDLERNRETRSCALKRYSRRSSVGLPLKCSVPDHVKTKIAGRLRAASVACESPRREEDVEIEQSVFEVSIAPLHSTMIYVDECNADSMYNIIPNDSKVVSDIDKSSSTPLVKDDKIRRQLNDKHACTYTLIQPFNKDTLRYHFQKVLGVVKLRSLLELAGKIKLEVDDIDILKRLSETMGNEHRDMLPYLFELVHFERNQMN